MLPKVSYKSYFASKNYSGSTDISVFGTGKVKRKNDKSYACLDKENHCEKEKTQPCLVADIFVCVLYSSSMELVRVLCTVHCYQHGSHICTVRCSSVGAKVVFLSGNYSPNVGEVLVPQC